MLFLKFKNYRNSISNLIKISKKEYYSSFFNENINNIKNTWRGIKNIININKNKKDSPESLIINNETVTDKKVIANTFNDFFTSIAGNLANNIIPSKNIFSDYLQNPNEKSFFIRPATVSDVK